VSQAGLAAQVRDLPHFCLSTAVARRLRVLGEVDTRIAGAPRIEDVLALIDEAAEAGY
jgi:hypothetical protein